MDFPGLFRSRRHGFLHFPFKIHSSRKNKRISTNAQITPSLAFPFMQIIKHALTIDNEIYYAAETFLLVFLPFFASFYGENSSAFRVGGISRESPIVFPFLFFFAIELLLSSMSIWRQRKRREQSSFQSRAAFCPPPDKTFLCVV